MFSVGSIGAIGRGSARSLDNLWRLAGFTPSFDFPFARNRSLVDAVTGQQLITFTRASGGTYVGSDGVLQTASNDEPRFDHDPTTGESLGLLVEEQRTNLLTHSEEFDDASWAKINTSIAPNAIIAPDGALTADKLVEDNATGEHAVGIPISFVTGQIYTQSVYAKAAERTLVRVGAGNPNTWPTTVIVDLSTGVITNNPAGTASVQNVGNGWYRISITGTALATATTNALFRLVSTGTTINYTGDGTSGIYLWGAQLESGAFPTSYIPTTTAAATRAADVVTDTTRGAALRALYAQFRSPASGTRGVASLNDNTANERASLITSGTDPRLVVHDGGVEQVNINGGTVAAGVKTRVAVRINADDFAISINGGAVVTDTSGTLPTVDRIMIGRTHAGEYLNGRIARFIGWNQLLSDATLRSLLSQ